MDEFRVLYRVSVLAFWLVVGVLAVLVGLLPLGYVPELGETYGEVVAALWSLPGVRSGSVLWILMWAVAVAVGTFVIRRPHVTGSLPASSRRVALRAWAMRFAGGVLIAALGLYLPLYGFIAVLVRAGFSEVPSQIEVVLSNIWVGVCGLSITVLCICVPMSWWRSFQPPELIEKAGGSQD